MNLTNEKIEKKARKYYPENLDITKWENVEKELKTLIDYEINSADDIIKFLKRYSELQSIIRQEMALRYIKMTCDTKDEAVQKAFNEFYAGVITPLQPLDFELQKKFYNSKFRNELPEKEYAHLNKIISNDIELYREKNVPISQKERELANQYGSIIGGLTIDYKGEEKTLTQMAVYLKDKDRAVRKETWELRMNKMAEVREELDKLYDELKELRIEKAKNADFDNYRDYMHQSKGRFAYTPQDIYKFHDSVEKYVIPFAKKLNEERKKALGIDSVKPWDGSVDLDGKVLKPFQKSEELIDKSINILHKVKPEFGVQLNKMKNTDLLDLDNRKGKAPGGYNYPLEELDSSFIFMNSVGLQGDVTTFLHESGHAMHAKAVENIDLGYYRGAPSEVAELASMAMELISMDFWDEFYDDENDLKKAKREQLKGTLSFLPWCMIVDAFQQWVYTNPNHTAKERSGYFVSLMNRFGAGVDWAGNENLREMLWMRQLHIFEMPFYYIEYGISQLGALAIYKNYKENPEKAIEQYHDFLKLGYSVPVDKIYETAGIKFDFSGDYIKELVEFVEKELEKLN